MERKHQPGGQRIGVQTTAVVTGSFLSGAMMGLSAMVVPVLLDTNMDAVHMLRQWVRLYHYGHIMLPALSVTTGVLYAYTVLRKRAEKHKLWTNYAVAGVATLAMVPFTWLVMTPTNDTLFGLERASAKTSGPLVGDLLVVQGLLVRWAWLHAGRSIFPLVGAILGFSGLLQEVGL